MCVFHYFNKIIKQLAIILIFISVLLGGGRASFFANANFVQNKKCWGEIEQYWKENGIKSMIVHTAYSFFRYLESVHK